MDAVNSSVHILHLFTRHLKGAAHAQGRWPQPKNKHRRPHKKQTTSSEEKNNSLLKTNVKN